MFRYLLVLIAMVLAMTIGAHAQDLTTDSVGKLDMLLVHIVTEDSVMPTCDFVDSPAGSFGKGITNDIKVPGRMVITLLGDTLYDSGDYEKGVSGMTVKITGNSSAYKSPKPYKIKLQQKADLLFRDDYLAYGDKEWRLLRDDRTLNTVVGLKLNELMGLQWTPQYKFCNVFINDQYQGLYMLIENVKRNTSGRIDVKKTGYIVERDAYWWNEDVYFKSTFFADGRYGWTFKYPESDEVTSAQIDYIKQYLCAVEAVIKEGGCYEDYIDVESFAAWMLAHDILGTWDSGGSNLYITKRDNTPESKLVMGCLWDFDSSRSVGTNSFSRYHYGEDFYFDMLMNNPNTLFKQVYISLWQDIKRNLNSEMNNFLTEFSKMPIVNQLNTSRKYVASTYAGTYTSISSNVSTQKSWFTSHTPWLNNHINASPFVVTPVTDIHTDAPRSVTYNLQGIPVPDDTPGLVIKNGKLVKQ